MLKFFVLISRDIFDANKIVSLYSPDFDAELISGAEDLAVANNHLQSYIEHALIQQLEKNNVYFTSPKSVDNLAQHSIYPSLQCWRVFDVNYTHNLGFFARMLPATGYVSNTITILAGCFMTYIALSVATKSNEDPRSAKLDNFTIFGTLLDATLGVIMYTYSDTTEMLSKFGNSIDHISRNPKDNLNRMLSSKISILLYLITIGAIIAHTVMEAIRIFQESEILIDKYSKLDSTLLPQDINKNKMIMEWAALYMLIIAGLYSNIAFETSFVNKFVNSIMLRLKKPDAILELEQSAFSIASRGMHFQFDPIPVKTSDPSCIDIENGAVIPNIVSSSPTHT